MLHFTNFLDAQTATHSQFVDTPESDYSYPRQTGRPVALASARRLISSALIAAAIRLDPQPRVVASAPQQCA